MSETKQYPNFDANGSGKAKRPEGHILPEQSAPGESDEFQDVKRFLETILSKWRALPPHIPCTALDTTIVKQGSVREQF